MKLLPANPGLTDLAERARSIHRRVRKFQEQGKFDTAPEQTAVLDLARVLVARQKIEASRIGLWLLRASCRLKRCS